MQRSEVFAAIDRERAWQEHKWGTTTEHPLTVGELLLVIKAELDEALLAWVKSRGDGEALREIVQIAAVAVAALEQHGVVERPWAALGHGNLTQLAWARTYEPGPAASPYASERAASHGGLPHD